MTDQKPNKNQVRRAVEVRAVKESWARRAATAGKSIDYRYLDNRLSDLEARILELEKHQLK